MLKLQCDLYVSTSVNCVSANPTRLSLQQYGTISSILCTTDDGALVTVKPNDKFRRKWKQDIVTIKMIYNVTDNVLEGKQTIRELNILSKCDHPNIIKIIDVLPPDDPKKFTSLYVFGTVLYICFRVSFFLALHLCICLVVSMLHCFCLYLALFTYALQYAECSFVFFSICADFHH